MSCGTPVALFILSSEEQSQSLRVLPLLNAWSQALIFNSQLEVIWDLISSPRLRSRNLIKTDLIGRFQIARDSRVKCTESQVRTEISRERA